MSTENSMQLKDFVESAITQIVEGLSSAKDTIHDHGGYVNPPLLNSSSAIGDGISVSKLSGELRSITTIDFDIAVCAEHSSSKQSGIAVVFAAIGAGTKEKAGGRDSKTHRIKFSVPILLPAGGTSTPAEILSLKDLQAKNRDS